MKILLAAEHDGSRPRKASLCALEFARQVAATEGGEVEILLIGKDLDGVAESAAKFGHVSVADDPRLEHPLADRYAAIIAARVVEAGFSMLVAASTGWAKDIIGRAAGILGGAMVSDVVGHEHVDARLILSRPMFAGEVLAKVVLHGDLKVVTVRSSAYPAAAVTDEVGSTVSKLNLETIDIPAVTEYFGIERRKSDRPDATEASIVVSGGRAFRDTNDFELNVCGLADKLGAAVGASRAVVDSGLVSNDLQIGQTGKVVAPDLYLALGLSGAIQHLAGITNSRIIAAVNKDPEAPIFSVANYGLVGDVHEAVPKMIKALS